MIIKRITISNFGAVLHCDIALAPEINLLDTQHISEISTAIEFILCSKVRQVVPPNWVRTDTHLTAEILINNAVYTVDATPHEDQLTLAVIDANGNNMTACYRNMLSHCLEQDAVESFDGQDKTLPLRLCWYRNCEDAPEGLSGRTERLVDRKTFRSCLVQYIKAFQSEPINNKKNYQTAVNRHGIFEVFYPGVSGSVFLSETDEKLFWYICFLNIAEFWEDIERLRDLHHERKPLLIRNFLERLDDSADISGLIARTLKFGRQVIILTPPLIEERKKKWIGEKNE